MKLINFIVLCNIDPPLQTTTLEQPTSTYNLSLSCSSVAEWPDDNYFEEQAPDELDNQENKDEGYVDNGERIFE